MDNFIIDKLCLIYKENRKTLRTGTNVFGYLEEEKRWSTIICSPLTKEEYCKLNKDGENILGEKQILFPNAYKELLSLTRGGWLFDLLNISGYNRKEKGLTLEEQDQEPRNVFDMQNLYCSPKLPANYFIFADCMLFGTFYAFDENENVIEIDSRSKKVLHNYGNYKEWLIFFLEKGDSEYRLETEQSLENVANKKTKSIAIIEESVVSYSNEVKKILNILKESKRNNIEIQTDDIDMSIHIFSPEEFEEGQLGYRVDHEKKSLLSNVEGEWRDSWFVIGVEEDLGDPLFVDAKDNKFPVYTAEHGLGNWEPILLLFKSIKELFKI